MHRCSARIPSQNKRRALIEPAFRKISPQIYGVPSCPTSCDESAMNADEEFLKTTMLLLRSLEGGFKTSSDPHR
jgi:hypothetical protein